MSSLLLRESWIAIEFALQDEPRLARRILGREGSQKILDPTNV